MTVKISRLISSSGQQMRYQWYINIGLDTSLIHRMRCASSAKSIWRTNQRDWEGHPYLLSGHVGPVFWWWPMCVALVTLGWDGGGWLGQINMEILTEDVDNEFSSYWSQNRHYTQGGGWGTGWQRGWVIVCLSSSIYEVNIWKIL